MLQLSHLPPPAIFEHAESLHAITLPPLATFLAHLTDPTQLRTLNEILEKYRTPDSYHRIDVRELGSSEIPIDTELEDPVPSVAEEGGEPVILEEWSTREAYKEARLGEEVARQIAAEYPKLLDPPTAKGPLPRTFAAEVDTSPVRAPSHAPAEQLLDRLPPSAPHRRVRELRLDLRTLDAAALFALETWRRAELGLEKLDMDVPQSIWYKESTPPPPKRKRGRPPKSLPSASPYRSTEEYRTASVNGEGEPASLAAALNSLAQQEEDPSASASAGPSRLTLSPSPDEICPDAYNETEDLDPSFIPDRSHAPSSASTPPPPIIPPSRSSQQEELPKPKRGRPSRADIAARDTHLPDGITIISPHPKLPKIRKPRRLATLQEGLVSSSSSPLFAFPAGEQDASRLDIADSAVLLVADVSGFQPQLSSASSSAQGTGETGRMEMYLEMLSRDDDLSETPSAKSRRRKSAGGSTRGDTPNPMAKKKNLTKEYKEYLDEWAFLKGL